MNSPVLDVIHHIVEYNISAMSTVSRDHELLTYEAVDVIPCIRPVATEKAVQHPRLSKLQRQSFLADG
ncbi:hypothetical protein B0T19DRAFT_442744 [Cercophora scortea]|uniref:Uncharacterized protein n=1 Tax=Cercophora scortea TaxID=314031 RepID=A0AAE0IDV3_9PEZI|nr:hypothetical protein B0T19DRAFT_442744 [Cercophora scortea]